MFAVTQFLIEYMKSTWDHEIKPDNIDDTIQHILTSVCTNVCIISILPFITMYDIGYDIGSECTRSTPPTSITVDTPLRRSARLAAKKTS